nr:indole-2-monooxygenase-like [Lolium perenne]
MYLLLFILLFLLLRYLACTTRSRSHGRLPPSPPKLPFIGHLHLVGSHPHVSLAGLSEKHAADGLMLLHLGQVRNLVVSSTRATEAVLRTHDHVFASRPHSLVVDVIFSGASDVAFAPYGEHWRQARKIITGHLLSAKKVASLCAAREEEARLVVAKLREARGPVDLSGMLFAFSNDIVCRAIAGKFFRAEGRNDVFRELINMNVAALGGFNLENYFPSLGNISMLRRPVLGKLERLKKRWHDLLDQIIDEHAAASNSSSLDQDQERDFVDALLSLQHDYDLTREHIKTILMEMFGAATDTSYVVIEFALCELLRNPHLMTKLQAEVRGKTPSTQGTVKEADLSSMTYLKAVIKETLRLHPPAPLLIPHMSIDKCDVNGYTIPAETRTLVNVWALGRDTRSWEHAEEFMPERFMDAEAVDFKGRDFQFLPFGAGRRICPGMNFGIATVEIMLTNLLHCFDWELPDGMHKEDIDMTDVYGLTVRRKEKLFLIPKYVASCV